MAGSCEDGNMSSDSSNGEFLDQVAEYQLFKEDTDQGVSVRG
jgi:hypothetical protein